jgi:hypothetical protein
MLAKLQCVYSQSNYCITGEHVFQCAEMLLKCLSHLHMMNMLICILYMNSVMEIVGLQNTGSTSKSEFHIKMYFKMDT